MKTPVWADCGCVESLNLTTLVLRLVGSELCKTSILCIHILLLPVTLIEESVNVQ